MVVLNADRVNAGIFSGDGSLLSNVTAVGTGLAIENSGSLVGTALTIDFNTGVEVQFSGGILLVLVLPIRILLLVWLLHLHWL